MPDKHTTALELLAQLAARIKPSQLAKRFGIIPSTLQRWLKRGIPKTKVSLVERAFARSARSQKAAATRKRELELFAPLESEALPEVPPETGETRELRKRLQAKLGELAVSEQLMRRLSTEFGIEQTQLMPTQEAIVKVAAEIKSLPGLSIYDILATINESQLEQRKWKLIEEFGLHNQRELYTLYHYNNSPKYGAVAI